MDKNQKQPHTWLFFSIYQKALTFLNQGFLIKFPQSFQEE